MEVYLRTDQLVKHGQAEIVIVTYRDGRRVEESFHIKECEDGKPAVVVNKDGKITLLKDCFW